MSDSPMSATPYEILGVAPTASMEELRRAYRLRLRQTHPDTGGNPTQFHAVQAAWERVGTAELRAAYDRGREERVEQHAPFSPPPPRRPQDTRPAARSFGHPGGWARERYLELMREWVGRGIPLKDPYDPALVRTAPRDIRRLLADALAEEASARALTTLGIGYTLWHDVATDAGKIDHVVLGPTGLFALRSEDFGGEVKTRRGELIGPAVAGERPVHDLSVRARLVARAARVKFTVLAIVVPDDSSQQGLEVLGSSRGAVAALVQISRLPQLMRDGLPGAPRIGGTDLFEVRTRLQSALTLL